MNSLWIDSTQEHNLQFPTLNKDSETDICIVGSGILGLTCAYFLTKLGFSVIILEKAPSIASKTTGHTTAKITSQHGLFYDYLFQSYGEKFAKDYLEANEKAITGIESIINKEKIKCDFEWQNNYVYTTDKKEIPTLKKEYHTLQQLGFPCEFVTKTGLPFNIEGSVCFKNQAQFHPLKYCLALCKIILSQKGEIYTNSTVIDCKKIDDFYITSTPCYKVKSNYVIMACHYPFLNIPGFYFTKMYQSTSYIIGVDTKKTLFNGMYINNTNPIFSYRCASHKGKHILLIGGGDHKTGQPSCYQDTYGLLEAEAKKYYPNCEVLYRWNTKDCISLDKIPYIGTYSHLLPHMYVGTGFKKWGMTSSYVASRIIVDFICGKNNPYAYLFDSTRLKPLKNLYEMKNIMVQSYHSLFSNKLKTGNMSFDAISNNSGSIIQIQNEKVGIYKDKEGTIHAVKPICTHLGCLLSWNDIDKTWDCPCHGSRFDGTGKNIYGPAYTNLEVYNIED